jgi:DNA polymerase III epsilon subunit-like protein
MNVRHGCELAPTWPRVDTYHDAIDLRARGVIRKTSLETLAELFGLGSQAHTAEGDVALLVEVYRCLHPGGAGGGK